MAIGSVPPEIYWQRDLQYATGKERGKYLKKAQKAYTEAIQQYEFGTATFRQRVRGPANDIDDLLQG